MVKREKTVGSRVEVEVVLCAFILHQSTVDDIKKFLTKKTYEVCNFKLKRVEICIFYLFCRHKKIYIYIFIIIFDSLT